MADAEGAKKRTFRKYTYRVRGYGLQYISGGCGALQPASALEAAVGMLPPPLPAPTDPFRRLWTLCRPCLAAWERLGPQQHQRLHGQPPACWLQAPAVRRAAHAAGGMHTLLQGVDLDQLLDMSTDELVEMFAARQRRRCACITCCGLQGARRTRRRSRTAAELLRQHLRGGGGSGSGRRL